MLPPLPKPLADACGALVGDTLYVAGGRDAPDSAGPSDAAYRIDLSAPAPKWTAIDPCPGGGRMLAVAAGFDGKFWLAGGADLERGAERRYRKDAYCYDPAAGWKRLADLPHPVAAAPSPAPTDATGFSVLGGDDGTQVGVAPDRHRGFVRTILRYDAKAGKWTAAGELPAARVTVPCVVWDRTWVVPGGEVRPGVRSPEVWSRSEK